MNRRGFLELIPAVPLVAKGRDLVDETYRRVSADRKFQRRVRVGKGWRYVTTGRWVNYTRVEEFREAGWYIPSPARVRPGYVLMQIDGGPTVYVGPRGSARVIKE